MTADSLSVGLDSCRRGSSTLGGVAGTATTSTCFASAKLAIRLDFFKPGIVAGTLGASYNVLLVIEGWRSDELF